MAKTVKDHAKDAAEKIARGANKREIYADIVRTADLTIGECAALRNSIDAEIIARLVDLQKVADSIRF